MKVSNRIVRVRGCLVELQDQTPVRFTGQDPLGSSSVELVRITLENGTEGIAGASTGWFGSESGNLLTQVQQLGGLALGQSVNDRQGITNQLLAANGEGLSPAESILDIAMWDAYARNEDKPIWQILGQQQNTVPTYASTPAFLSIDEYLDITRRCIREGYRGIKYHMNCDPEFDREMVQTIDRYFPDSGIRFMVDLEQRYTLDDAVLLGEILDTLPYDWMEAPLPDSDLSAYIELNQQVNVDILPAGNTLVGLEKWEQGLSEKAWSRLRCDASNAGGITGIVEAIALADRFDVPVELQSFGYITSQMANLHLIHSSQLCTWFEHPFPFEDYEFYSSNTIRVDQDGQVQVSSDNGLGITLNWDKIEVLASESFDMSL